MKTSLRGYVTEIDLNTDYEIEEAGLDFYIKVAGDAKPAVNKLFGRLEHGGIRNANITVNLSQIVRGATVPVQIQNLRQLSRDRYFDFYYLRAEVHNTLPVIVWIPKPLPVTG